MMNVVEILDTLFPRTSPPASGTPAEDLAYGRFADELGRHTEPAENKPSEFEAKDSAPGTQDPSPSRGDDSEVARHASDEDRAAAAGPDAEESTAAKTSDTEPKGTNTELDNGRAEVPAGDKNKTTTDAAETKTKTKTEAETKTKTKTETKAAVDDDGVTDVGKPGENADASSAKDAAAKSARPAQAATPAQPSLGATPAQAAQAAQPAQPAQPAAPAQAAKPAQPAIPAQPATPAQPAEPVLTAKPAQPAQPAQPATPAQPAEPVQTAKPAEPAQPAQPATPARAAQSAQPATPARAAQSAQPAQPALAALPAQPAEPLASETPVPKERTAPAQPASAFAKASVGGADKLPTAMLEPAQNPAAQLIRGAPEQIALARLQLGTAAPTPFEGTLVPVAASDQSETGVTRKPGTSAARQANSKPGINLAALPNVRFSVTTAMNKAKPSSLVAPATLVAAAALKGGSPSAALPSALATVLMGTGGVAAETANAKPISAASPVPAASTGTPPGLALGLEQAPGQATSNGGQLMPASAPGQQVASQVSPAHPSEHALPPSAARTAIGQVAVHITKAVRGGIDRIMIRLHPAELGRVEVKIEMATDGRVTAAVLVDKPETLDLLQRDSRSLERALEQSGLRTDSGGLSFNLRGQGHHGARADEESAGADKRTGEPEDDTEDTDLDIASLIAQGANTNGLHALDIRV